MSNEKEDTKKEGLSNIFSIYMAKRERDNKREFFNETDKATAVYIANKQGEAQTKKNDEPNPNRRARRNIPKTR